MGIYFVVCIAKNVACIKCLEGNWHNIGTVLLFRRKFISAIISTVKNLQRSHSGMGWFFVVKVVIIIFYKKIRKALANDRAEANYFVSV